MANPFESTKACLTFDERPITPPEIRKFRRSAQMEPGKRSSRFDDAKELGLHDRVFGEASEGSDVTAAALINLPKTTMLQDINRAKTERIYQSVQREPLGKSFTRNYNMPEQCGKQ